MAKTSQTLLRKAILAYGARRAIFQGQSIKDALAWCINTDGMSETYARQWIWNTILSVRLEYQAQRLLRRPLDALPNHAEAIPPSE